MGLAGHEFDVHSDLHGMEFAKRTCRQACLQERIFLSGEDARRIPKGGGSCIDIATFGAPCLFLPRAPTSHCQARILSFSGLGKQPSGPTGPFLKQEALSIVRGVSFRPPYSQGHTFSERLASMTLLLLVPNVAGRNWPQRGFVQNICTPSLPHRVSIWNKQELTSGEGLQKLLLGLESWALAFPNFSWAFKGNQEEDHHSLPEWMAKTKPKL